MATISMSSSSSSSSSPMWLIQHPPPCSYNNNNNNNNNPMKKLTSSRSRRRVLMLAKRDSHNTSSSSLIQLRSSPINSIQQKVFEDKSRGIVCYMDDKGEITCEGFDEGPRLHHGASRFSCYQRVDQDIVDLLKRSLLQVTDGGN